MPPMQNPYASNPFGGAAPGSPRARRGTITLIRGCMFSGKTGELLRRLHDTVPGVQKAFKHRADNRFVADAIVSHDGRQYPAMRVSSPSEMLSQILPLTKLVALDEAHFFDASIVDVVCSLRSRMVDVILTALDRSSWGRSFSVVEALMAVADETLLRRAFCAKCGAMATMTQRKTPIVDGNLIGGAEDYEPRCERCWAPPPEEEPEFPWLA
ncbi:MAG: thymidine kinase [Planctomycetes bacterium]|nr:thymidine kinase [Planctomycetota bacterium]